MYVISDEIKRELRKVIGKLIEDENVLFREVKKRNFIVSIGDMVGYSLLKEKIKPRILIVDFKHRRRKINEEMKKMIEEFGDERIYVNNPPSIITDDLIKSIEVAYKKSKNRNILLIINGEEDLASLITIYLAPPGATVIYGLPDKGVVLIDVTDKEKEIVKKTLERCAKYGD